MNGQFRFESGDRRGLDQTIHAEPSEKADVIGNEDVVEARNACARQERSSAVERTRQHLLLGECAYTQGAWARWVGYRVSRH